MGEKTPIPFFKIQHNGDPEPDPSIASTGSSDYQIAQIPTLKTPNSGADFLQNLESDEDREFAEKVLLGFDTLFRHPAYAPDTQARKKLNTYVVTLHEAMIRLKAFEGMLGDKNNGFDIKVSTSSITEDEAVRAMGMRVGAALYGLSLTEEQMRLARKNGAEDAVAQITDPLNEFSFRIATLAHKGISLSEFANPGQLIKEGKILDAYGLFTDTSQIADRSLDPNDTFKAGTFQQSYALVYAFAPEDLLTQHRPKNTLEKEILKHALLFANGVKDVRREIGTALFDSSHPLHQQISEVVLSDIKDPKRQEMVMLLLVNSIRSFYRKAQRLSIDEQDRELGEVLMSTTLRLLDDIQDFDPIHRVDDLEAILDPLHSEEVPQQFADIRKKANDIFQRSARLEYSVEGRDVAFPGIIPPKNIHVYFEKGKPTQVGIEMQYQNDHGEELEVDLFVDAKLGEFDWSLLEDPAFYPQKQQALMNYLFAVLGKVEDQAVEIQRNKHKELELVHPQSHKSRAKRKTTTQSKRKPYEGNAQKTSEVLWFINNSPAKEKKPPTTKNFRFDGDVEKILRKLAPEDRTIALARLQRISEAGSGRVKLLSDNGRARKTALGNLLGKVEISGKNGGSKGIRILVEQESCGDGKETWIVREGDYRANVYKGNSLEKM